MNRRQFLRFSSGAVLARSVLPQSSQSLVESIRHARGRIEPIDRSVPGVSDLQLSRTWKGELCESKIVNRGKQPVRIKEVILFAIQHNPPPETQLYGESFQMLSQTGGTVGRPVDLGYSELRHYKLPQPADVTAASGLLMLSPPTDHPVMLAFTSCRRFIGRFYLRDQSLEVLVDTEGLELGPGRAWDLEEFTISAGLRSELLARLAAQIGRNHPHRSFRPIPTGWCSWYCFGPRVTAQQVLDNLDRIAKDVPNLKYVQIDDGYQSAMGDWLETGKAFGGDVVTVLNQIRQRGFEPAIWVAPFIAEKNSQVFQQHPDWFIQGADRKPLPSNQVTFGGWRHGPWYALDGTHPEVQRHFEELFRTMRHNWGCSYFKLDANFWGAMHGGRFHDPKATRVEAYRRGMEPSAAAQGTATFLVATTRFGPPSD